MKKYICDCCKKEIPEENLVKVEARKYLYSLGYREISNNASFDLCFDCCDKIFTSAFSQKKEDEK